MHKLQPRAGWYREQVTALQDRVAYQLKEEEALEEEETEEEDTEEEETEEEEMTSRQKKEPCKAPKRPAGNVLDSGALVLKHPGDTMQLYHSLYTCTHTQRGDVLRPRAAYPRTEGYCAWLPCNRLLGVLDAALVHIICWYQTCCDTCDNGTADACCMVFRRRRGDRPSTLS